jgi:GT2 family glycosyltransferase
MRLTAGLLYHNDEAYAERCLETLVTQEGLGELGTDPSTSSGQSWQIVCLNNGSTTLRQVSPPTQPSLNPPAGRAGLWPASKASKDKQGDVLFEGLKEHFPGVTFETSAQNLGFGAGHNRIMRNHPADFHAVLNIDVLFNRNFLKLLLDKLERNPRAGSACGKLLHWDTAKSGDDQRTNVLDSAGIGVSASNRFYDIGQGKGVEKQYNEEQELFGGSGAAVVYRRSALDDTAYDIGGKKEYFDETFFMYKEDIDLAYRLQAAGHSCLFVPTAIAWHARTLGRKQRKHVSPQMRAWSAAHESWILRKHRRWFPMRVRAVTSTHQLLKWTYLAIREPNVFARAQSLLRKKSKEARMRRKQTKHTVPFKTISHLFGRTKN